MQQPKPTNSSEAKPVNQVQPVAAAAAGSWWDYVPFSSWLPGAAAGTGSAAGSGAAPAATELPQASTTTTTTTTSTMAERVFTTTTTTTTTSSALQNEAEAHPAHVIEHAPAIEHVPAAAEASLEPAIEEEPELAREASPAPLASAAERAPTPRPASPAEVIEVSPSLSKLLESADEPEALPVEEPAEERLTEEAAPVEEIDVSMPVNRAPTPMPTPEWFNPPRWEEHLNLESPIPLRIIDDSPSRFARPKSVEIPSSESPRRGSPKASERKEVEETVGAGAGAGAGNPKLDAFYSRMTEAYSRLKPYHGLQPKPEPRKPASQKPLKPEKASKPMPIPKANLKPLAEDESERDEYIPPSLLFRYAHPQRGGVVKNKKKRRNKNKAKHQ